MDGELAVYGIRLAGLGLRSDEPVPPEWPRWTIEQQPARPGDDAPGLDVWEATARVGMPGIGRIRLDRAAQHIAFETLEPWPSAGLLHPGLAPAATVIAHWMGRVALHGAAVAIGGRAWGLLGDQGAGKSTLAAATGLPLVTDDLLIADDRLAYAGPAAIDLRDGRLGGVALGRLGARDRWRLDAVRGGAAVPLGGFVALGWRDGTGAIETVTGAGERLATLDGHLSLPTDAERLLTLAERPMVRFLRPGSVTRVAADASALVTALAERN